MIYWRKLSILLGGIRYFLTDCLLNFSQNSFEQMKIFFCFLLISFSILIYFCIKILSFFSSYFLLTLNKLFYFCNSFLDLVFSKSQSYFIYFLANRLIKLLIRPFNKKFFRSNSKFFHSFFYIRLINIHSVPHLLFVITLFLLDRISQEPKMNNHITNKLQTHQKSLHRVIFDYFQKLVFVGSVCENLVEFRKFSNLVHYKFSIFKLFFSNPCFFLSVLLKINPFKTL